MRAEYCKLSPSGSDPSTGGQGEELGANHVRKGLHPRSASLWASGTVVQQDPGDPAIRIAALIDLEILYRGSERLVTQISMSVTGSRQRLQWGRQRQYDRS